MQGIKFAITIMTTLLVIGLCLFAYGIATQTKGKADSFQVQVTLPAQARIIESFGMDDNKIGLRIQESGSIEYILIVDSTSGKKLGHIDIQKEKLQ